MNDSERLKIEASIERAKTKVKTCRDSLARRPKVDLGGGVYAGSARDDETEKLCDAADSIVFTLEALVEVMKRMERRA